VRLRLQVRGSVTLAVFALTAFHGSAQAQLKPNDAPIQGQFSQLVPIEVPAFRGLEPRLALAYSSEGRSGFAGVGWALSGFSSVVRTRGGRGVPRFDATDVFMNVGLKTGLPPPLGGASGSYVRTWTYGFNMREILLRMVAWQYGVRPVAP
jgi:Salmonella virulence plasmid 65kDa B protein